MPINIEPHLSRGVLPRNLRGGPYAVVAHGGPTPLYNLVESGIELALQYKSKGYSIAVD